MTGPSIALAQESQGAKSCVQIDAYTALHMRADLLEA